MELFHESNVSHRTLPAPSKLLVTVRALTFKFRPHALSMYTGRPQKFPYIKGSTYKLGKSQAID